jgi:methyl-accepting chemotaxis protein
MRSQDKHGFQKIRRIWVTAGLPRPAFPLLVTQQGSCRKMSKNESLRERLAFVGMDQAMCATLREMRPLIAKTLPEVLDGFYTQVAKTAQVGSMFANPQHMRHAKEMQLKHWDTIASAEFSEAYLQSVTRIGETHNRLGLEPRWYIGGYSFILSGVLREIETGVSAGFFGKKRAEKKAAMMSAFTTAALLDMDFAISVYLEAGKRDRNATLEKLATSFSDSVGRIVDNVSGASMQLEGAAGTLTRTAEQTQQLSASVATASEQASANVQSVASATEEMTSSVNEISRQVQESSKIASEAVQQARGTDARIAQLSQAAGRIGDVVKLITAIADQTNLLALNATIEAARAGDAGRGFAVVASEVKALAAQTSKATEEIGAQIDGMQTATQESVAAIKEIGQTIGRISEIAATIAAAVEEQGAATQEIARNVGEAAKGTSQVAGNITEVNRGATETGTASSQVLSSAQSLSAESANLKSEVANFLQTVRTA